MSKLLPIVEQMMLYVLEKKLLINLNYMISKLIYNDVQILQLF